MSKIIVCYAVLFLSILSNPGIVRADTLSYVLNLYGTSTEIIDTELFKKELIEEKENYLKLKNDYSKDEYLRRTEDVATGINVGDQNLAQEVEIDKKYLESLVNIGADLEKIFEAEADYRKTLIAYQSFSGERLKFSLDNYSMSHVSVEELNYSFHSMEELNQKIKLLDSRPDIGDYKNLKSPTKDVWNITSSFAYRTDPINGAGNQFHNGLDLAAPKGTEVLALFSGKILKAGDFGDGYGNCVLISHSNEFQTFYAHMEKVNVSIGDFVSQYDAIGAVGSTGRSTGPHLHLGMFINGQKVDPVSLFEEE